jgi:hypothetical protein
MKQLALLQPVLLMGMAIILFSCQKEVSPRVSESNGLLSASKSKQDLKFNTFKGPQVQMGDGKARSWITISHTGMPAEIGIEITADALTSQPQEQDAHPEYTLPLHQKALAVTPFDHIGINWNPGGHPPFDLFGVPHFDFHFYLISVEDQIAIPPHFVTTLPPAGYMPSSYMPDPVGIPMMGVHWSEPGTVAPGTFTHTMIYGSYNDAFIFVEPMVTLDYLLSGSSVSKPYAQPTLFAETGTYYPTTYNIYWDEKKQHVYITLSNFVWR